MYSFSVPGLLHLLHPLSDVASVLVTLVESLPFPLPPPPVLLLALLHVLPQLIISCVTVACCQCLTDAEKLTFLCLLRNVSVSFIFIISYSIR